VEGKVEKGARGGSKRREQEAKGDKRDDYGHVTRRRKESVM